MVQLSGTKASGHSRTSRPIDFLGEVLIWCCGVLTNHSISNEKNLKKVVDDLSLAVNEVHADLINLLGSIKNYSSQMGSELSKSYIKTLEKQFNLFHEYTNKKLEGANT